MLKKVVVTICNVAIFLVLLGLMICGLGYAIIWLYVRFA